MMNVHDKIRETIAYDFITNEYIIRHDYEIDGTRLMHQYTIGNEDEINECRDKTILEALKVAVHIDGVCYPKITVESKWCNQSKIPWKLEDELTLS